LAIAAISAALMPAIDAPEFPLVVDRTETIAPDNVSVVQIRADDVDVRLVTADQFTARLSANLRRTFGQSVDLEVDRSTSPVTVSAVYREGLSWGINDRPLLVVSIPADGASTVEVISIGGEVDLSELPAETRARVTVGPQTNG
jgi:hypothetical protein